MRSLRIRNWTTIGVALAARVFAQDVTVTDPVWSGAETPPEVMPRFWQRPDITFPSDAKKTDEINYVIVHRIIDAKGKQIVVLRASTQRDFSEARCEEDSDDARMKPAQRGDQPVGAEFWYAVIFNPASAAKSGRNCSPRLLTVTQALVPKKFMVGTAGSAVVKMRLEINSAGMVVRSAAVFHVDPELERPTQEACSKWRFAAARQDGRPVASTIDLPVVVEARPDGQPVGDEITPPKATKQVAPQWPDAMRGHNVRLGVRLFFDVDIHGNVQNPAVVSSSNPGFEAAAVAAIRQWKFQPATKNGSPVTGHIEIPIIFSPIDEAKARDGFSASGGTNKMPPGFRYDVAPHTLGAAIPIYPYELLRDNVTGTAQVGFLIGAAGLVTRTQIIKASRPEFGLALAAALETYEFEPALFQGKPTPAILNMVQSFSRSLAAPNSSWHDTQSDYELIQSLSKHPDHLADPALLDHPLEPTSQRPPVFPVNLAGRVERGSALIEIVIDDDGIVRSPRVISASLPEFGYAAAQAVAYWRFKRPTLHGKTVITHVQVPFNFGTK